MYSNTPPKYLDPALESQQYHYHEKSTVLHQVPKKEINNAQIDTLLWVNS